MQNISAILGELDMRNPDRIDTICGLLAQLWKKYPDLRLGQLLEGKNIFPAVVLNGRGAMMPFFQEDDETERRLRELL